MSDGVSSTATVSGTTLEKQIGNVPQGSMRQAYVGGYQVRPIDHSLGRGELNDEFFNLVSTTNTYSMFIE